VSVTALSGTERIARAFARDPGQGVHAGIVAVRVVMEQHEPLHVRHPRHVHGVLDGAVAPAGLRRVVRRVVLRVVDHHIRIPEERRVVLVARVEEVLLAVGPVILARPPRRALVRFVVGRVHERAAGAGHPVAEGRRRVIHELRPDA
jgi:hypothetical protein